MAEQHALPPFRRNARCPKCWGTQVETEWKPDSSKVSSWEASHRLTNDEHLARRCKGCGYEWAELPMDQVEELQQLGAVGEEQGG